MASLIWSLFRFHHKIGSVIYSRSGTGEGNAANIHCTHLSVRTSRRMYSMERGMAVAKYEKNFLDLEVFDLASE